MKYVVEQFVEKIQAPIVCNFDGEALSFDDGIQMAKHEFDKRYLVDSLKVENDKVVIELKTWEASDAPLNYTGDEAVSFF